MDQEKVSSFIKEIRLKNNLTQKELADKYGVTYQAVSKWENGKNLPDMLLLKQISKDFNVSLDEILDGEYKKNNNYLKYMIIILAFLLVIAICVLIIIKKNDDFEFKTLSSTCGNFNISGSLSYNDNKSAIYISSVEYCGEDDDTVYKKIDCTLYETHNDTFKKISSYNYDSNITLKEFLKDVTFSIDNYSRVCKEYSQNSLYLEINATDSNDKIVTYKISLSLEDNC